jgi:holo-[acyl-carrier protein] synthase
LIIGIGSDLCDIERIETTLARHGERFTARCFTETEQRRSDRRAGRAASYAKRFAAKEACAKALGTGLRRGVFWRDMGVVNLPSGQPTMKLTGGAAERLKAMLPPGTEPFIHLTLTDEGPYAQAFVVIEARLPFCCTKATRAPRKARTKTPSQPGRPEADVRRQQ